MRLVCFAVAVVVTVLPALASAEVVRPREVLEPVSVPVSEPAGHPLDGAPRPEEADGVVVARAAPPDRPWLRGALLVPRMAVAAVLSPVRLALWAEDTYQVSTRTREVFWNDEETMGFYPTAGWDGGRNARGGAVFVHRDLFGAALELRATAGTVERYHLAGAVRVGRGPATLELSARHRDAAGEGYHGIGDVDVAVSRYGIEETIGRAGARWQLGGGVSIGAGGSIRQAGFRDGAGVLDDPGVAEVHDVATIPGFTDGVRAARGELSVQLDRRRTRHAHQSRAAPSTGWAAQAYAGWQRGLEGGARFGYGGADLMRAFDLFGGDRVLSLRMTLDGVGGDPAQVPFVDLPTLGGTGLLRGYASGRFRDRWAASASAEYMYPVTDGAAAFVFADAGRVAPALDALAERAPRLGFGFGVQAHSRRSMLARLWLASSIDGGVIASLRVEPVFAPRGREVVR